MLIFCLVTRKMGRISLWVGTWDHRVPSVWCRTKEVIRYRTRSRDRRGRQRKMWGNGRCYTITNLHYCSKSSYSTLAVDSCCKLVPTLLIELPEVTVVAQCGWWAKSMACELVFQGRHGGGLSQLKRNSWPPLEVVAEFADEWMISIMRLRTPSDVLPSPTPVIKFYSWLLNDR